MVSGSRTPSGVGRSRGTGIVNGSTGTGTSGGIPAGASTISRSATSSGAGGGGGACAGSSVASGAGAGAGAGSTWPSQAWRSSRVPAKTLRSTASVKPGTSPVSERCQNSHSFQPPITGSVGSETPYSASHSGNSAKRWVLAIRSIQK